MQRVIRRFVRTMFIQAESTPNKDSIKFKPGCVVLPGGALEMNNPKEAKKSPLARNLFRIEGVKSVFYGSDFVTVTKDTEVQWQHVKPDIFAAMMDQFQSERELIVETNQETNAVHEGGDSEVVQLIKELLDSRIRPTIQDDGGDVEFKGFENGVVKLKLMGACRTCDSSTITLKNGIENMMMHYIPEVTRVEQALDETDDVSNKEFRKLEEILEGGPTKLNH